MRAKYNHIIFESSPKGFRYAKDSLKIDEAFEKKDKETARQDLLYPYLKEINNYNDLVNIRKAGNFIPDWKLEEVITLEDIKKSKVKHSKHSENFTNNKDFEKWQKEICELDSYKELLKLGFFTIIHTQDMHGESVIIDISEIPEDLSYAWHTEDIRLLFSYGDGGFVQIRDDKVEGTEVEKFASKLLKDIRNKFPKNYSKSKFKLGQFDEAFKKKDKETARRDLLFPWIKERSLKALEQEFKPDKVKEFEFLFKEDRSNIYWLCNVFNNHELYKKLDAELEWGAETHKQITSNKEEIKHNEEKGWAGEYNTHYYFYDTEWGLIIREFNKFGQNSYYGNSESTMNLIGYMKEKTGRVNEAFEKKDKKTAREDLLFPHLKSFFYFLDNYQNIPWNKRYDKLGIIPNRTDRTFTITDSWSRDEDDFERKFDVNAKIVYDFEQKFVTYSGEMTNESLDNWSYNVGDNYSIENIETLEQFRDEIEETINMIAMELEYQSPFLDSAEKERDKYDKEEINCAWCGEEVPEEDLNMYDNEMICTECMESDDDINEGFEKKSKERAREDLLFPHLNDLSYFDMDSDAGWRGESGEDTWIRYKSENQATWEETVSSLSKHKRPITGFMHNEYFQLIHQPGMPPDFFIKDIKKEKYYHVGTHIDYWAYNYNKKRGVYEIDVKPDLDKLLEQDVMVFGTDDGPGQEHYLVMWPKVGKLQNWLEAPSVDQINTFR